MFPKAVYVQRRERLRAQINSGLILLLGNDLAPMNCADNAYPFRQDSSFLYFLGLDEPGLAAIIDVDRGTEQVFGDDLTVEQIVWTGPQPALRERCEQIGVTATAPSAELDSVLKTARQQGRTIHFLPQYRPENILKIRELLGIGPEEIQENVSESLIRAVVEQRSFKSPEEIAEIDAALDITYEMQTAAMQLARPGVVEREVAGALEGIAVARGVRLSFATIFSIHGEILHNPNHSNTMKAGDIAVNDCGAESSLHYAGDITRTIPIGGKFSPRQKEIYSVVLDAQEKAITAIRPGVEFRQVHRLAGVALLAGLKEIGLVKGDPEEAVDAGVHTLFFQCGLGHMLGLDVHDMDALGEDYVGYTDTIRRNPDFGWRSLRLAKALEPGFVVTVEPGVYFIPTLIDRWQAERRHESFVNYDMLETYRDFGGIRLEDDVLVTTEGHRVLGKPIPKTVEEVEARASA